MTEAETSRWCRAFVTVGIGFFVASQAAVVTGIGRPVTVTLGLYGFVFHVIFGKAYALIPAYFDRKLWDHRAIAVHLPLATTGAVGASLDGLNDVPSVVGDVGAVCWLLGCFVFVGTLAWTVRDNLSGTETGTGADESHRRRIDQIANAFVPVVLAYLLLGAVVPVLERGADGIAPMGLSTPVVTHVLAAGTGVLLVFAVGFRLLPRFLVETPRPSLVVTALVSGAIAPAALAIDFQGEIVFRLGAVLQAVAVVAFATAFLDMYRRTDRDRVGFHAVATGACFGVVTVLFGLYFAFVGVESTAIVVHYRLALTGFLGLTIVGVSYVFYPPSIATTPGAGDRSALWAIGIIAVGLSTQVGNAFSEILSLEVVGTAFAFLGATLYAYVVWSVFLSRR